MADGTTEQAAVASGRPSSNSQLGVNASQMNGDDGAAFFVDCKSDPNETSRASAQQLQTEQNQQQKEGEILGTEGVTSNTG